MATKTTFNERVEEIQLVRGLKERKSVLKMKTSEITSKTVKEVLRDGRRLSKRYVDLPFKDIFGDLCKEYHNHTSYKKNRESYQQRYLPNGVIKYIIIKDMILGLIRVDDMGENYVIDRTKFRNKEALQDFIDFIEEEFGIKCQRLNEYIISIPKKEREEI